MFKKILTALAAALVFASAASAQAPRNLKREVIDARIANAAPAAPVAIASGAFTLTQASHILAAESGTADTVTSFVVTAMQAGDTVKVTADTGDAITIDGSITDNSADIVLDDVTYAYVHVQSGGYVVSRGGAAPSNGGEWEVVKLSTDCGMSETGDQYAALKTCLETAHTNFKVFVFDGLYNVDFAGTITLGGPSKFITDEEDFTQGITVTDVPGAGVTYALFQVDDYFESSVGFYVNMTSVPDGSVTAADQHALFQFCARHTLRGKFIGKEVFDTATINGGAGTGTGITFARGGDGCDFEFARWEDFIVQDWWRGYYSTNTDAAGRDHWVVTHGVMRNIGRDAFVFNQPGALNAGDAMSYLTVDDLLCEDIGMDANGGICLGASSNQYALIDKIRLAGSVQVGLSFEETTGGMVGKVTGDVHHRFSGRGHAVIHVKANIISDNPADPANAAPVGNDRLEIFGPINVVYTGAKIVSSDSNSRAVIIDGTATGTGTESGTVVLDWERGSLKNFYFDGFPYCIMEDFETSPFDSNLEISDGHCTNAVVGLNLDRPWHGIHDIEISDTTTCLQTQRGGPVTGLTFKNCTTAMAAPSTSGALLFSDITWIYTDQTFSSGAAWSKTLWTGDFSAGASNSTGFSGSLTMNAYRTNVGTEYRVATFIRGYSTQGGITGSFSDPTATVDQDQAVTTWGDTDFLVGTRIGLGGSGQMSIPSDGIALSTDDILAKVATTDATSNSDLTVEVHLDGKGVLN